MDGAAVRKQCHVHHWPNEQTRRSAGPRGGHVDPPLGECLSLCQKRSCVGDTAAAICGKYNVPETLL